MEKHITSFTATLLIFIAPIWGLVSIIFIVVFLDTFAGVYSSIKLNGLKSIRSNKLFNMAIKLFFYLSTILLAYVMDVYIFDMTLLGIKDFSSKAVTIFWVLIELKSIDETSIKLGNKPVLDVITSVIAKAKELKKNLEDLKK